MTNYLVPFSAILLIFYSLFPLIFPHKTASLILNFLAPEYTEKQIPILASFPIWNWSHRIGGALLLCIGLFQLKRFSKYHRYIGYVYVILAMTSAIVGSWMIFITPFVASETLPTLFFAFLLITFIICGISNAKNLKQHKKWMQRSFTIVLGLLFVRIVYIILSFFVTEYESMTPSFWIGWGIPLIIYEMYWFGLNKIEADSSKGK